jgi:outer membrane protein assembly factor BamB
MRNRDQDQGPNGRLAFLLIGWAIFFAGCGWRSSVEKVSEIADRSDVVIGDSPTYAPEDWPMWRGPQVDGIGVGAVVPVTWSATENVLWKTPIPGRGHASPTVISGRVVVATADESQLTQSVCCLDLESGEQQWQKELHRGKFETAMHRENSQATSTVASDGERLYVLFLNDRKIWATALRLNGEQVWQTEVGTFASKFGYSASPTIYRSLVIVGADHQEGGYLAALDRKTGEIVWRTSRPAKSSYATPRVVSLGGRDQLVICGCGEVAAYDPLTGKPLWKQEGTAESAVGTPVVSEDRVFASGGYPQQDTVAIDGKAQVAWRKNVKAYCTSLLAHDGHLYLVSDDGVASCFEAATGAEKWKKRLGGGYRASPVLSGENILVTDMSGKTHVFQADPSKFTSVAENQLGSEGWASPAISAGRLLLRVVEQEGGRRQEYIYCIGKKP